MVTVAEGLVRSSLDFRHLAGRILNPGGLCFPGSLAFWELNGNQLFSLYPPPPRLFNQLRVSSTKDGGGKC
jgi:hypothetical protein